jgi:hypothetical protein
MSTKTAEKKSKKQQGGEQQQKEPTELKKRRAKVATATPSQAPAPAPAQTDDSDAIVVFAIRLSRAERDLIHQAAGPAKASRFVKGIALAAARGDREAIDEVLKGLHANGK